jgi:tetratricopeptide (TPR) repeat protein
VIDELIAAGLLRRFGERPNSQLEVAHEALLRHWDHIYALVAGAEMKERLHLIKQIGREAGDWAGHERSNDYLSLRGERLARAISHAEEGWLAEAEVMPYIDACAGQEATERLNQQRAKEEKERADVAEKARDAAELRAERFRRRIWQLAGSAVLMLAAVLALGWYHAEKQSSALEVAMFELKALNYLLLPEQEKDAAYAKESAAYARQALSRDPASDAGWFYLGVAEDALGNRKTAVEAFDKVSPAVMFFADALNNAAAIYFEHLGDTQAAYQRLVRAVEREPNNLHVLSNYAEILLAVGHKDRAKATALRARGHAEAQLAGNAHIRAAMSFVVFCAELLSGNLIEASGELEEIERHVTSAAAEARAMTVVNGKDPRKWGYQGIRRSLEGMQDTVPTPHHSTLLTVLAFVETNGQEGALEDMRRLLGSQLPTASPLLRKSALSDAS